MSPYLPDQTTDLTGRRLHTADGPRELLIDLGESWGSGSGDEFLRCLPRFEPEESWNVTTFVASPEQRGIFRRVVDRLILRRRIEPIAGVCTRRGLRDQ
jgi:hypothetical protein